MNLDQLDGYSDNDLWAIVNEALDTSHADRMRELMLRDDLSPAEQSELESLMEQVDQTMLLRLEALGVLRDRGHDVSAYL